MDQLPDWNTKFYCPKCGLYHLRLKGDTLETIIICIHCGNIFTIADASTEFDLEKYPDNWLAKKLLE